MKRAYTIIIMALSCCVVVAQDSFAEPRREPPPMAHAAVETPRQEHVGDFQLSFSIDNAADIATSGSLALIKISSQQIILPLLTELQVRIYRKIPMLEVHSPWQEQTFYEERFRVANQNFQHDIRIAAGAGFPAGWYRISLIPADRQVHTVQLQLGAALPQLGASRELVSGSPVAALDNIAKESANIDNAFLNWFTAYQEFLAWYQLTLEDEKIPTSMNVVPYESMQTVRRTAFEKRRLSLLSPAWDSVIGLSDFLVAYHEVADRIDKKSPLNTWQPASYFDFRIFIVNARLNADRHWLNTMLRFHSRMLDECAQQLQAGAWPADWTVFSTAMTAALKQWQEAHASQWTEAMKSLLSNCTDDGPVAQKVRDQASLRLNCYAAELWQQAFREVLGGIEKINAVRNVTPDDPAVNLNTIKDAKASVVTLESMLYE